LNPDWRLERDKPISPTNSQEQIPVVSGKPTVMYNGVELTISDEIRMFDKMSQMDIDKAFYVPDPDGIFSYSPYEQWEVLNNYLQESGHLDSLTEEEKESMKQMLQDMTYQLDSISYSAPSVIFKDGKVLDSYELQLELDSSKAAFQYFSNKFLGGSVKEGFDKLSNEYTLRHEKKMQGYQSHTERFHTALSKMDLSHMSIDLNGDSKQRMLNKLGKVEHTDLEIQDLQKFYVSQFELIEKKSDIQSALLNVKEQMIAFLMKGISEKDVDAFQAKEYISTKSENTFKLMEDFWNKLIQY